MNSLWIDDEIRQDKKRFLATREVVKAFFIAIQRELPQVYYEVYLRYNRERDSVFCVVLMPDISNNALRIDMPEYSDVEIIWGDDTTELSSYHYEEVNYMITKVKDFFSV